MLGVISCSKSILKIPETTNTGKIVLHGRIGISSKNRPWTKTGIHVRRGDQVLFLRYGEVKVADWSDLDDTDKLWYRIANGSPKQVITDSYKEMNYFTIEETGQLEVAVFGGKPHKQSTFQALREWGEGNFKGSNSRATYAYDNNSGSYEMDVFIIYKSDEQFLLPALSDIQRVNKKDKNFKGQVSKFKKTYGWMADLFSKQKIEKKIDPKLALWLKYKAQNNLDSYLEFVNQYPGHRYFDEGIKAINSILLKKYKKAFWENDTYIQDETIELFSQLADEGVGFASALMADINYLGFNDLDNLTEAFSHAQAAKDQGDIFGAFLYSKFLFWGIGVDKNEELAKDIAYQVLPKILKQAYSGEVLYQYALGWLYQNGVGVPENKKEAFLLYQKSAINSYPAAQYNIGISYLKGIGVKIDYSLALKWIKKFANLGFARAQNDLGWIYENGSGVSKNISESVRWYKKAANQGLCIAQLNLGILFEFGKDRLAKNLPNSKYWYEKAANQGDPEAIKAMNRFKKKSM